MPRPSLYTRLHEVKPCSECAQSGGLWAVDRETGREIPGKRCHCLRGQLLAKADARRGLGRAA